MPRFHVVNEGLPSVLVQWRNVCGHNLQSKGWIKQVSIYLVVILNIVIKLFMQKCAEHTVITFRMNRIHVMEILQWHQASFIDLVSHRAWKLFLWTNQGLKNSAVNYTQLWPVNTSSGKNTNWMYYCYSPRCRTNLSELLLVGPFSAVYTEVSVTLRGRRGSAQCSFLITALGRPNCGTT